MSNFKIKIVGHLSFAFYLNLELCHLILFSLTAFFPSNATAEVVPVDLEEERFFFLAFFNH